jgi:hypothetical protein
MTAMVMMAEAGMVVRMAAEVGSAIPRDMPRQPKKAGGIATVGTDAAEVIMETTGADMRATPADVAGSEITRDIPTPLKGDGRNGAEEALTTVLAIAATGAAVSHPCRVIGCVSSLKKEDVTRMEDAVTITRHKEYTAIR